MRICAWDGCERSGHKRGLCSKHYQRATKEGRLEDFPASLVRPGATLDERLRHHGWIVTESGCWEWTHSLNGGGYGQLAVGTNRPEIASRAAYMAWVGPIPDGQAVCHRCDNPPCIRPDHLFLGSLAENNADMAAKRRTAHGELKPSHKLTDAHVSEIRSRYAAGGVTQAVLAEEFGVSQTLVHLMVRGKRRVLPTAYPRAS